LFLKIEESVNLAAKKVLEELKDERQHVVSEEIAAGFLSRAEVIDLLKISSPTLHRYQTQGLVPFVRVGRKCLYNKSEVLEALNNTARKKRV
jgi:hypothetical protein